MESSELGMILIWLVCSSQILSMVEKVEEWFVFDKSNIKYNRYEECASNKNCAKIEADFFHSFKSDEKY
jgi:hypothetical protein